MIRLAFVLTAVCFASPAFSQAPLPADVDAAFQAGVHPVIGCEGCHWEEPDRIPRDKVATVCGDCHPGPQKDYATSVHWDNGNIHAVCTDCHGIHGILPVANPDSKAHRSLVCGTCHPGPMEELGKGSHRTAFDRTDEQLCASCHGNHAVQHPTIRTIQPACETCHARGTDAFTFGAHVSDQFELLRSRLAQVRVRTEAATSEGYDTGLATRTLSSAEGQIKQARLVWHSLDAERIDVHAEQTASLLDRTMNLIQDRIQTQKMRENAIVIVWIIIAVALIALHLKRKSLEDGI
jgi:hypothetical protein